MLNNEHNTSCTLSLLLKAVLHDAMHSDAHEILLQSEATMMRVSYRVGNELREQLCLRRFIAPMLANHLRDLTHQSDARVSNSPDETFLMRWSTGAHGTHVSYAVA